MKNKVWALGLASVMIMGLTACGAKEEVKPTNATSASPKSETAASSNPSASPASAVNASRKISYLGKEYVVPAKAEKIVIAGSIESMEDALVLGVKPTGASTVGGKFPPMFAKITQGVEGIGEKSQPNIEAILKLKPDVILSSTKFPAEAIEKLSKVATTIPVSHISTDWETNLNLLGEIAGKQEEAKKSLQSYKDELKVLKEKIGPVLKDKKVLAIRVRAGSMFIYPADVFFNPSIYAELGATVPEEVKQAKAQQLISMEKLSEINPDFLFVQFSEEENKDTPKIFDELKSNPIWKSINANKSGNLYTNLVDPIAQGGTAYSKISFLEAVKNSKLVQTK
ncbi:ABC transporter substrate-binding protein [Paenibacillus sp. SYP-B3998]|uniref:ABC transporter substrate-binding protein n=1 Tax=Paenibacillus sp. SYP-B3998 TaxID=2678564 RepID=A0A6G3ZW75_9BACL|nr:ABC transporter substrate-binding protein [Paenibacillus sp. SYP-B3998]NEW06382.1 ABC transporter substrate-binding protein [Paenibacillus sp. SYP-B3998]